MVFVDNASVINIIEKILKMKPKKNEVIMLLLAEGNSMNIPEMISELNKKDICFFGGIFPALIYKEQKHLQGAIIISLPQMEKPYIITGLNTPNIKLPKEWNSLSTNDHGSITAMIFVDGLTSNISNFLSTIYKNLGNSINYLGGGAGSLDFIQKPCVFSNEGCFQDAAVVSFLNIKSYIAVEHGWQEFAGPVVATKTDKNAIIELNWENALDVYSRIIEEDSRERITMENFLEIAKGYPFGILGSNLKCTVRDPLYTNNKGHLFCAGEVNENSVLAVLKGDKQTLINAATKAISSIKKETKDKSITNNLILNCISRALYLGKEHSKELTVLNDGLSHPVGAYTIGEISSTGEGFLEFYNKTLVVGALYEE